MAKSYGFSGINLQAEQGNVDLLISIFNDECEQIIKYWLTSEDWAHSFEYHKGEYWMIQELHGLARAMFFMDLLDDVEQASADYIYDFCKAEVERRRNESND